MKKTLSLVLMLCMLVSVVAPALVFAEAGKAVTVNVGDVPVAFDEAKLDLLADGNTASDATAFSNAGLVGFENKGFTHTDGADAAVEATFEIILDLGEVQTIGSISLDAYKESNSMIALPTVNYYVSVDGVNYYQINAGGKVSPAADAAESKVHTLKADFSTRIAVEAQYVKAVVSFKNGWVFLSELSVGAGNETVASEAPDKAYPYSRHTVPNPGVGIFDIGDGVLDLAVNDGTIGQLFRNAQLIKAAYDAELGAYVIEYSKVNPWPDGHSGTEELAEGEILVAISTGGVVTSDEFSGCKWIARGLTAGDLIVLNEDTIQFLPAGALVPEVPDEPEPVELPEGALLLDYAGYKHAGVNSIVAGDGMTVSELTALGNDGNAKDMNYAYIVVVDADNVVVQTWCELSVAKSDVVCPEGGYIISFNGNKDGYKDLAAIEEGAVITLYNVDVDAFRGAEGNYELTNAGFTYENPAVDEPVTPPVAVEKPENAEMFWVTHYENNTVEGSGVIFTKPYDGAVWWLHFAFAPIDGVENAYEIVEISNGLSDGSGTALAIPEGGFVWATNTGNDYPTLGMDGPDYTSPNCNDAIARALNWAIGDQFVVGGFDFVNVPTSTPDVDWYDDAYVCTAWIAPYEAAEEPVVPEPPVAGGNLAAGKDYTTSAIYTTDGIQNWPDEGGVTLTDGIKAEIGAGYFDAAWVGFNKQSPDYDASEGGFGATTVINLGASYDLSKVCFQAFGGDAGISVPYWVNVYASADGENYEYAGSLEISTDAAVAGVNAYEVAIKGNAQYVKVCFYGYGWIFIDEIEIYGAEGTDTPVDPEPEDKTYENTMVKGEDGNFSCEVPYGFTWVIDDLNGSIGGEDNTICTTQDAYNVCNPNWAITIYAEKQADGTYVALKDAIVCPGSAAGAGITIGENQIAIVIHSAYSNPNGTNWESKVVAMAVKAGDVLVVDMDAMTVYAPIPGESEEPEPSFKYGDVNGDGVTNSADVARLMRYLADYDYAAGTSSVEIFAGADCNGDGIVDGRDSVKLLQYLADREPPVAG
ncbi:MAG: hypothetical protein IJD82_11135 [Clostridia bacterium]|nr:hypothetical protein [Clostridia bacterium]